MSDFLLELRSEEIPARMQAGARADLEKLFRKDMDAAGVALGALTVWSTPRRLTLIARGLPTATAAVSEELKGPRVGAPPQALEGFLRKTGLSENQLTERDGVFYAVTEKPGRATAAVLADAIPAIIRAFPWPKSQRWGAASLSSESLRWVRPLSAIVALFGGAVVPCEVGGIVAGRLTLGHRFHSDGEISIDGADDYAAKLRAAHVIVDHAERQDLIRVGAAKAAQDAGLTLVEDEGLVIENAGLTEWPVPLLGRFDAAFLDVPPEVIQLTARTNQKYFVCESPSRLREGLGEGLFPAANPTSPPPTPPAGGRGVLANAFVCTANIAANDGGAAIVDGNRKVLAARLSDARFFWEQDRKKTLAQHAEGLARITFHEKLGTVADKVERVAKLARWLVEEGIVNPSPLQGRGRSGGAAEGVGTADQAQRQPDSPHSPTLSPEGEREILAAQAELAAQLCKADLVTEMVGEFPELQGLMGGYYARAEGLPDAVADAIRDHYKPVGQGDDVPTAPVTVAVSLADKLDTLAGFFAIGSQPTGSKDPYALRRAILGIIRIVLQNRLKIRLAEVLADCSGMYLEQAAYENRVFTYDGGEPNDQLITTRFDHADDEWVLTDWFVKYGRVRDPYRGLDDEMAFRGEEGLDQWPSYGELEERHFQFLMERLRVQQREIGNRHDLIDAVFATGATSDLVRLLARVHALQAFIGTDDGTNLLAGYKRAANILKKEGFASPLPLAGGAGGGPVGNEVTAPAADTPTPNPSRKREGDLALSYTPEPAEKALIDALAAARPKAEAAVAAEDFAGAMAALATLRGPIDAFFDQVTVNDADDQKRLSRLALLASFRDAVHGVADFSQIEG